MQSSNTNKALKGMSSQTLVTFVLGIVEIASFAIMSRLLSQEDFGYYAAITAVTMVFSSFSETGVGASIIQRKEIDSHYVNNCFTISFIFGAFISLLLVALAYPLACVVADKTMTVPLMLMSITLIGNCLTSVNISIMYRRLEFLQVGVISLISLVITTIVAILLALGGFGYYAILAKAIFTSVLSWLISSVMCKTKFKFEFSNSLFKSIFGFSGWLMASVFFRNLAQQLDKLLMARLLSISSLGAYNRPKEFIGQISSKFGGIFDTALFPVLSQIQDNKESMRRAYLRSMYMLNLASVVLALGFIFNGELIIRIFFGEEWLRILSVFQILSLAVVFNFDARLADCYLRSHGWTKQQFFFRMFEVGTKIIGLLVGYHWGLIGIALSVLSSDLLMVIVKHVYIARRIGVSTTDGVSALVKSWQFSVVCVPLLSLAMWYLPHSMGGCVINAVIFVTLLIVCFLICPSIAGREYKEDFYQNYVIKILNKLHLK